MADSVLTAKDSAPKAPEPEHETRSWLDKVHAECSEAKDALKIVSQKTVDHARNEASQLFGRLELFDTRPDKTNAEPSSKPASTGSATDVPGRKVNSTESLTMPHPIEGIKELYHWVRGDKSESGSDAKPQETKPLETNDKAHLQELATKLPDREKFQADMAEFEKRSAECTPPLSPEEVENTYKQISRLIDSDHNIAGVSSEQRIKIAEQIMSHAARPTEICQGDHNTCGVATLESKLFTTNPSQAAKLIADVTIDGQYETNTKPPKTVKPDLSTLTAKNNNGHDYDYPPATDEISQASRIFQVTAVTIADPTYVQKQAATDGDTGERISVLDKDHLFSRHEEKFQGLQPAVVNDIAKQIGGHDIADQIILNNMYKNADGHTYCGSPEELGTQLASLKAAGKLPAIIQVDCGNEPFCTDSKGAFLGDSQAAHYVTVTDYVAGPPAKVAVDNQWSRNTNHLDDKAISLDTLYYATLPAGSHEQIVATRAQIQEATSEHKETTELELKLSRLQYVAQDPADKISKTEYERELKNTMGSALHRWEKEESNGTINEAERKEAWIDFFNEYGLVKNDKSGLAMATAVGAAWKASQSKHHNTAKPADYYREYQQA
jgi:hypothetical protein